MTPIRIGINGFGRMGRLTLRAGWDDPDLTFVHVNEPAGDAATAAHLLTFDSVHGRWERGNAGEGSTLTVDGQALSFSQAPDPADIPWGDLGVDLVLECSGRFRTIDALQPHLDGGAARVVVAAPVKEAAALNVVVGINDHRYDPSVHRVLTAASCTTNCLAPVAHVIHEGLGIAHGSITTGEAPCWSGRRWGHRRFCIRLCLSAFPRGPRPRPCRQHSFSATFAGRPIGLRLVQRSWRGRLGLLPGEGLRS